MNPEIMEKARQLRAAGASIAEVEQYLQSKLGAPAVEEPEPGIGTKVLGTLASTGRDIPGVEGVQATARAVVREGGWKDLFSHGLSPQGIVQGLGDVVGGDKYKTALSDIRQAEDAAPKAATIPARLAGGTLAAMATPGGAVLSGARYGAASALLDSDQNATLEDRLQGAGIGMATGAAAGKAGEVLGTVAKGVSAPSLGKSQQVMQRARVKNTKPLYDKAIREGDWSSVGAPGVSAVLDRPDIKMFADMVRGSREFAGANDATIVRETYKLMTKQQGGLMKRLREGYDAKADLELGNITKAKEELAAEADILMPSFRTANKAFAGEKAKESAFKQTAAGMNRVVNKSKVAPQNLHKNSTQSLEERIAAMSPAEAEAGLRGALGSLGENMKWGIDTNLFTGMGATKLFGVVPNVLKANRATPFIRQLEKQAGRRSVLNAASPFAVAGARSLEEALGER